MEEEDITFLNSTTLNIWYFTGEILVALIAIPGNLLVLISFYRIKNLRRHSNYFIISLAIGDLLIGCLSIPLCLALSIGLPKNNLYGCLASLSILRFVLCGSMFSYLLVTFDRWWAIAYPYSYQRKMKKSFARGFCFCSWTLAAILSCLQLVGWYNQDGWESSNYHCFFRQVVDFYFQIFSNVVVVYIAIVIMFCVYVYIYRVIKKQQQKLVRCPEMTGENIYEADDVLCHIFHMKFHSDSLLAMRLGKIVLVFMLCQMPLATILCIWTFCSQEICAMWPEWTPSAVVLIHANAALNPLLYAFHLPDFQVAMKNTISFIMCRK